MSLYEKLRKQWPGAIYQRYECERKRFEHLSSITDYFKKRNVLEVGASEGVQTLEIAEHASSVIAIEPSSVKFERLQITMDECKPENVQIVNIGIGDFARLERKDFDVLYTSFVTYHFSGEEIDLLKSTITPQVDTWILYNRAAKRKPKNKYCFEKPENMVKFMEECGFKVKWEWQKEKIWYLARGFRV